MKRIDINCDMGESFGTFTKGNDEAIMPYITSANIACGFHAGDPAVMERTVQLALQHQVNIGAHPGLPDLAGFGRREIAITPKEAYQLVVYQIGALSAFVHASGGRLHHVKPHGALYNMAGKNRKLAEAIVEAVVRVDPSLVIYARPDSELQEAAHQRQLTTATEVFADRTYQTDGSLTPRNEQNALITDTNQAMKQVLEMVENHTVTCTDQSTIVMKPETICIHGDGAKAIDFAKTMYTQLTQAGISIQSLE
ncbi:LamB/YcsF family protein [Paraliobacillus ryukyuensis]|uniref:LamB/YcsF family protein n=1 Tax=Paraliobacillus ryukyuensis TaxID=200904 RepID=UPI0009A86F10|nr:5-oxoprolinase subunit PxpA [Paraliobacillus ryukyuensis]